MTSEEAHSTPRQHSVKVPRLYKVASKLLKEHRQGGKSVKALSFSEDTRKKHPNVKGVFALLSESSRRERQLSLLIRKTGILRQETGLDEDLARVLLVELLFTKGKLPGGKSRPEQTVLKYEEQLRKLMEEDNTLEEEERIKVPRYARVNTLKISLEAAVSELIEEDGCEEVHVKRGGFVETASNLEEHQFVRDPLVPNLLAFASGTSFHGHRFYHSGKVLLQDRASCLPVTALRPPRDSVVLDACAAPGMKTTQLAAAVGRVGKVYAVERSKERADILRKMLADSAADKVTSVVEANFLDLNPNDYQDVEHIVLDPSCSGSGMLQRSETNSGERRLQSLSFVQAKLFKHALSFPNLKSMVYSTCSVYKEENEEVLKSVFEDEAISSSFEVKSCLPDWSRRGEEGYDFSQDVVRCQAGEDLCNGFFVALVVRKEKKDIDHANAETSEKINGETKEDVPKKKTKKKKDNHEETSEETNRETTEDVPKKKKKKKSKEVQEEERVEEPPKKKKKKKSKADEIETTVEDPKAKKKKKKKRNHDDNE